VTLSPDVSNPNTGADPLEAMMADPEIRQSLAVIVANAPTLAALASMSSLLLQRGPEITDNINGLVRDLREHTSDNGGPGSLGQAVSSLAELAPLAPALAARTDTITGFLDSSILQPEIVDVISRVGEAALAADMATRGQQAEVGGIFAILKELKDPRVQETLAFLFAFAKVFGQQQSQAGS
jgi:uncharacterized protein YjgD (DUF1641 family)